jgi:hypothetical protein
MGPASIAEAIWEVLVERDINTRWLSSWLACDGSWGRRGRVGGGSGLEVSVLVVERNFAEFSGEVARDYFGKRHDPGLRVGCHGEAVLKEPALSAVQTQDPKMKVSSRLKATVGLMRIEAVEFAMRSSARSST